MKTISRLLTAGVIGLTGVLAGCGGGGAGGIPESMQTYSISVRADKASLPLNIAGIGPSIGGAYTTTLYVEVKGADGKPAQVAKDAIGCSYVEGLDSGPLYYLDGDPAHETKIIDPATGEESKFSTPIAYRAVTLSTNAGLASFHFHASNVAGPAKVRCSVTDPSKVSRSAETSIQVGSTTASGRVSQVVWDAANRSYVYVQGYGSETQVQLQIKVVDEAGQLVTPAPGVNNLHLSIVPNALSLAEDDAILRGVNAKGRAVSGSSILVESINGQAEFTLVSGKNPGTIQIKAVSDREDNNVDDGIFEAVYNYVAVSAVTTAPSDPGPIKPLAISTSSLTDAQGGIPYGFLLEATGGVAPYTWTMVSAIFDPWLSLSPSGVISGIPTVAKDDKTYPFVVEVQDARNTKVQANLSLKVLKVVTEKTTPSVVTSVLPKGKKGASYIMILTASGGTPPYNWTAIDLPEELTLESNGVLYGVPKDACSVATAPGTDKCQFALQVEADGKISAPKLVTFEVDPL